MKKGENKIVLKGRGVPGAYALVLISDCCGEFDEEALERQPRVLWHKSGRVSVNNLSWGAR
jgi:hypothetical protein